MYRVLIADDERVIRGGLESLLKGEGYEVFSAVDGKEALARFDETRPHLVLLDIMMPGLNGFCVCERIRERDATVPVVFLTAREGEADEVRGLGLGADDYIAKSAPEAVLLARVARALRRCGESGTADRAVSVGEVHVDLDRLEVGENGLRRRLTRTEGDILRLLLTDRNRFFTKEEVIEALRGKGYACEDEMVYSHVYRLRGKLGGGASKLVCDRRAGYRLRE